MRLWQAVYLVALVAVPISIAAGEPVNQHIQEPLIPYDNGLSPPIEAIQPQIVHELQHIKQSANPSAMMHMLAPRQQILSNQFYSSHSPVLAHHTDRLNTGSRQSLPQLGNNDKTFQDSNKWGEPNAILKQYGGGSNALDYAAVPMDKVRNAQRRPVLKLNGDRGTSAADRWPIIVDSLDAAAPENQNPESMTSANLAVRPKRVIRQLPLSSKRKRKCMKALSPTNPSKTGTPSGGANTRYRSRGIVHGVNIGGFLVPEFWITPSLIANIPDPKPVDYLQMCKRLGQAETLRIMRIHWESWVSESEVQRLASAGLTHLRIPIGHWEFMDSGEGYVGGGLPYFKRLVYWANKYGLRVIPDIHTAPGSQNGFDNSGTAGGVNWTNDPNNVELSKQALQGMLKFLASDPVLLATVDGVDLLNEPMIDALDFQKLWEYDTEGYTLVSTLLKKTPPVVSIIDRGFKDYSWWKPRWPNEWNSKNIDAWLDAHLYHVFDHNIDNWSLEQHLNLVCQNGRDLRANSASFPIIVGEWSLALPQNALNGRENEARRKFAEAQLDAYEQGGAGWVFWCFKTENSPEWSFLDALDRSWIPQPLSSRNFPSSC